MKDRFDMFRITSGMDLALGRSGGSVDPSNVNKGFRGRVLGRDGMMEKMLSSSKVKWILEAGP